eukprot:8771-Heterococcus_DN1.PRE.2
MMLRPPWYRDKVKGHYSRDMTVGGALPKAVIGDAIFTWRISAEVDGLGDPQSDLGLAFECIELPLLQRGMPGNKSLRGWLVKGRERVSHDTADTHFGTTCIVGIHGGGRDRRQWLRHMPIFHKVGCTVLSIDCQEHGLSDGKGRRIGWATYERSDAVAAAYHAKHVLGYERVILIGTSMGGAGVLLAAGFGLNTTTTINSNHSTTTTTTTTSTSTLTAAAPVDADTSSSDLNDLDEQMRSCIDGVIAENAPATRRDLAQHIVTAALVKALGQRAGAVVATVLWPLVYLIVMLRSGGFGQPEPLQAIKLIRNKPVLLIHGTADVLIPWSQAQVLYDAANEPKQLYIVEGATHTATYNADPVAWSKRVLEVVKQVSTASSSINGSSNGSSRSAATATVAAVAATAAS